MLLSFGKLRGRTVAEVVLKEPDYLLWMLDQQNPTWPMAQACTEARKLIRIFDGKPFLRNCRGTGCGDQATRVTVYGPNIRPEYWWDECDPYSLGADEGKLQEIRSYSDAIHHVGVWCQGRKTDLRQLIGSMAGAKGLARKVGAQQAVGLFGL
jgi:hypothetical protein